MSRGKTGLIVLTLFAAMFFLFVAILFGSSTKRQGAIDRKEALDAEFDAIASNDLKIYWIGEPSREFEHLMPVVSVIDPGSASGDDLPVKGPSFHITEYNEAGQIINENIPIEYPSKMLIVMTGSPVLSESGKEALLDAVSKNGVPVLAIGDDAAEALGDVLSYRRFHKGEGSSLYYCLGHGYKENPIPQEAVTAGEMDLAEKMPEIIMHSMEDYTPQN